uniref:Uncharacterized protein n=1 Tax=Panagrellus redivivus TaxID=6233 RepID=A0A7E5A1W0_PANRE
MPFPFYVLPYGLRQRLITISTPQEAHDIQVAVKNDISGLQPMQLLKSVDIVSCYSIFMHTITYDFF